MPNIVIRDATASDFDSICALNRDEEHHTSPMDKARLRVLDGLSVYHRVGCVDGCVASFLLAMRSDAFYENDNFAWFARRFPSFIYVDRIVVSGDHRGLRLGASLYEDLFGFARSGAIPRVTCEYNILPPNEPSRRFHDRFGFREQGRQWVAHGSKLVSLQAADTREAP
jgi:predicted GNAT superfamily acetyltransferase